MSDEGLSTKAVVVRLPSLPTSFLVKGAVSSGSWSARLVALTSFLPLDWIAYLAAAAAASPNTLPEARPICCILWPSMSAEKSGSETEAWKVI